MAGCLRARFDSYPFSHSLAANAACGAVAGLLYWWRTRYARGAGVLSLCVVSHWLLDMLTHLPDMPLFPGGPRLGLSMGRAGGPAIPALGLVARPASHASRCYAFPLRYLRAIASVLCACAAAPSIAAAQVSAFPGAQGFGAETLGGRGGQVLLVTNLNDSGPGSLRAACQTKGPRIVVFRVAGVIDLKSAIVIEEPYITIAGQSAPGDGVCLRGDELNVRTHDAVLRFLRVRPGDIAGRAVDAISVGGNSRNVVIDHCSATWSVDEALSASGAISNVTVQWCLIGEPLNKSVHPKGPHGYGSLVRAVGGVSLHHNLWVHNRARSPRLGDNYGKPPYPTFDVRNNVIYNYGDMASGLTGDVLRANYVANYIRPGPDSNRRRGIIVLTEKADASFYVAGNVVEGGLALFDRTGHNGRKLVTQVSKPFDVAAVRTTGAATAFAEVLDQVGATRPVRDAVDRRIVNQVRTRTGRIIDSQRDVGGWPVYRSAQPPADLDMDGLPDKWERAHGLNPRNAQDASKPAANSPYTNIEVYLNELAGRALKP